MWSLLAFMTDILEMRKGGSALASFSVCGSALFLENIPPLSLSSEGCLKFTETFASEVILYPTAPSIIKPLSGC